MTIRSHIAEFFEVVGFLGAGIVGMTLLAIGAPLVKIGYWLIDKTIGYLLK